MITMFYLIQNFLVRGDEGSFLVRTSLNGPVLCEIKVEKGNVYYASLPFSFHIDPCECFALYLTCKGTGSVDLLEFTLS